MRIIDGIRKIRGRPGIISDCGRDDLPEFWKEMGFKVGVEIGVYYGEFSEIIAKSGLTLYSVDPWRVYRDFGHPEEQAKHDRIYEEAKKRLTPYPNCILVRKTSIEALDDFNDDSLDFVYIDGNHHFRYIADDIVEWTRKLKKGGVISGHDYIYTKSRSINGGCDVHYIVDAYVKAAMIRNFWVLGRKEYIDGEKRDRWRSWMWFKDKNW